MREGRSRTPAWSPPDRRTPRRGAASAVVAVAVTAMAAVAPACGGDEPPSAARFCGEVEANKDALTNPTIAYVDDIEPVLDLYRDIAELAPIGISEEWGHLVTAYETASTVVPGNVESEQAALAAIYSSEKSAAAIDEWLRANCAVDIGPVFTIVPHGDAPPATAPPTTPPG